MVGQWPGPGVPVQFGKSAVGGAQLSTLHRATEYQENGPALKGPYGAGDTLANSTDGFSTVHLRREGELKHQEMLR